MGGPFRIGSHRARAALNAPLQRMAALRGVPIHVIFRPELASHRGKLVSREAAGTPVHAGSDIRRREMVLDSGLLRNRNDLVRIFVHEAYHFVWVRLGNPRRSAYEAVVQAEFECGARGELGWSAELIKSRLTRADRARRSRRWRAYVCESFCDTAAWMYAGLRKHEEWTLAGRFRRRRAYCLNGLLTDRQIPV